MEKLADQPDDAMIIIGPTKRFSELNNIESFLSVDEIQISIDEFEVLTDLENSPYCVVLWP